MSTDLEPASRAASHRPVARWARPAVHVLVFLWFFVAPVSSAIVLAVMGNVEAAGDDASMTVARIPFAALLALSLFRPRRIRPVYWLLPTSFLASAIAGLVTAIGQTTPVRLTDRFIAVLPQIVAAILLYLVRFKEPTA